jgi:uncharacterized protein
MQQTKLLILRLTDRCNLACRYCYAACNGSPGADMSLNTAKAAIALFAQPGDKLKIQFTGGEPLLCTELMREIFFHLKQTGIQTAFSLQTNGTLLTRETCTLLKEMRCAVGVSLDGIGEANGLRVYPSGRTSFEDALEGIRMLGRAGMRCNFNAVVTRANQSRLGELVQLAALLGNVPGVGLDMFRPIGRGAAESFAPDTAALPADITHFLKRRAELAALGADIRIKELEKVRVMLRAGRQESCYCYAQTGLSAAVDPKGDIYPCSSFVGIPEMRMGNVTEGFRFFPPVPGPEGECISCADAAICRGGCPAGRFACGGRNEADCLMHRTIIEYGRKEYA